MDDGGACTRCETLRVELGQARERIVELERECESLRQQRDEAVKLSELQAADLERFQKAYDAVRPNHPERVAEDELQLGFEQVLASLGVPAVNDVTTPTTPEGNDASASGSKKRRKKTGRHLHGRRPLDLSNLEKKEIVVIPPEVAAAGGKGFRQIGEEISSRIARRPASVIRLVIRRPKFVRTGVDVVVDSELLDSRPILIAPTPESVWPNFMADPSVIAHVIVSKYDDILPLHRQERISARDGFVLPRSTQCGWLKRAHEVTYRISDAMFADAKAHAFCIATDATGGPVRADGQYDPWDVFVFLADRDHIVFRHVEGHATSDSVKTLLAGFHGHLLADAAPVYDALFETGDVIEHCCWFHCRRYFYRALETEKTLALGPLSLIAKLFEIDRECSAISDPNEYTALRAKRAAPLLELLDKWVEHHRDQADPRGPLEKAIGYYENQRDALHRFVDDSRIRLSNNLSEQQLRNLAQGRDNWRFFANETGVRWYTNFRSLVASCHLHELNPETYLEEILRLAPHWPVTRVLELAPKYWSKTRDNLDARQLSIIRRPWVSAAEVDSASRAPPLPLSA